MFRYPPTSGKGDPFKERNVMNTIKTVVRDTVGIVGNVAKAAASLTLVATGELLDATETLATGVRAVPAIIKATINVPKATAIGYVREDRNIGHVEATKVVDDMFPASVAEAITSGSTACGALLAAMMQDDDDNTENLNKLTKKELIKRIVH